MSLPERTARYNGPVTEAHRWDTFEHRPDDIFICTPPKCGTTWTQTIVAMLVFGRADIDVQPSTLSPWIDSNIEPVGVFNAMLSAQTHRRFIKTHTSLDGIPFFPECTYLGVYRDPRDVYFSLISHILNRTAERMKDFVAPEVHSGFREWALAPFEKGVAEQWALADTTNHFESFWRYRALPNLHLFHFADLKRDLPASIVAFGKAIGVSVDRDQSEKMARTASFENMKSKADQFAPGASRGAWKVSEGFFDSGKSGRWRGILDDTDLAIYRKRIDQLLAPDAARWLENGSYASGIDPKSAQGRTTIQ